MQGGRNQQSLTMISNSKIPNRYKTLVSRPISACTYPDSNTKITLGIRDTMVRLLNTLTCTIWSKNEVGNDEDY
jgi:hypothetical protein